MTNLLTTFWQTVFCLGQAAGGAPEGGVAGPAPGDAAQGGQPGFLVQFFANPLNLLLLSAILFIFLVLRPQQKQMREHQKMLESLKKNDRVVTSGGVHGVVVQANAQDGTVTIRIDENSGARMTVSREAIAKVIKSDEKEPKKA